MPKIDELSKSELLSLIYHHLSDTVNMHPCFCAACGKDYDPINSIQKGYICDQCNEVKWTF